VKRTRSFWRLSVPSKGRKNAKEVVHTRDIRVRGNAGRKKGRVRRGHVPQLYRAAMEEKRGKKFAEFTHARSWLARRRKGKEKEKKKGVPSLSKEGKRRSGAPLLGALAQARRGKEKNSLPFVRPASLHGEKKRLKKPSAVRS